MAGFPESNIDWSKFMNALLGRATVDLDNLTPKGEAKLGKGTLIETYVNGASGYRIWSDGFCEQWGYAEKGVTVNLVKAYKDVNYNITIGVNTTYNNWIQAAGFAWHDKTPSSFVSGAGQNGCPKNWKTCGYLPEGSY